MTISYTHKNKQDERIKFRLAWLSCDASVSSSQDHPGQIASQQASAEPVKDVYVSDMHQTQICHELD